ncbi:MAG: hypothetical protein WD708_10155 [Kiritimatiellia bacterium]
MKHGILVMMLTTLLSGNVGAEEMSGWREVFADDGWTNWEERWFRDGETSTLTNTPEGMVFTTGPVGGGDASHMVFEKVGETLRLTASMGETRHTWSWNLEGRPELNQGRVGLRQMRGRSSRIANFKVFEKAPQADPLENEAEAPPQP